MTGGDAIVGTALRPVMKATSSSADRLVGSARASVTEPIVRPIGTTPYLRAIRSGISLMISGAIFSGNVTSGMPYWRERKWMSRSSVSSLRRTRISPSFSPVLFWSASARSSCSCVTRRSETSRSPKRLPTGAWLWPRGATVMAPTLTSRPSSGRASGGLGCSCRRSVPIASRLDPQTRCQPRGSGRVEGKQEFSQWRRRATGGPSGQFRCRVASFFSARLLAVALPLTAQYRHLLVERSADGFVVTVTLNRPDAMNAMNTAMGEDLLACFDGLLRDSLVRAVVFTGAGDRAFCAGGDLKERNEMTDEAWRAQHVIFERAASRVLRCPVPVIAAVEGFALAGGCELAVLSDFIVASETAVFGVPETTLAIFPGIGGTQLLPRILGAPLAKELIFTGRRMKADEAKTAGLVNHLVPPGHARAKALEIAETIARNGPFAVRQAKKAIAYGLETDLDTAMILAIEAYNATVMTEDRLEGVRAFNEKRKALFKGR